MDCIYTKAVPERYTVTFGQGSGESLRVFWQCTGTENFLLDCPTVAATFCNEPHELGAGVYCFGKQNRLPTTEARDKIVEANGIIIIQVKFHTSVMMGILL